MAIFREHRLQCPNCRMSFVAHLADSVNVARAPDVRQAVLQRRLHRVTCPRCGIAALAAKNFLYVDSQRNLHVAVGDHSADDETLGDYITHRVATMEGLRELVVAAEHGLSSTQLGLFKFYLHAADPRLQVGTSMLVLEAVDDKTLTFVRHFVATLRPVKVEIARAALESMFPKSEGDASESTFMRKVEKFTAGLGIVFDTSKDALAKLKSFARALQEGRGLDLASGDFNQMLNGLPAARELSRSAQADLDTVFAFACATSEDEVLKRLFEARFGIGLNADWLHNHSQHDLPVMWAALRDLPDGAVERNDMMKWLNLAPGERGLYHEQFKQIDIGGGIVDAGIASLRHCILHEVGHAAHAEIDRQDGKPASAWLAREFGWRSYDPRSPAEIDAWIDAMGGYPSNAEAAMRQEIRDLIGLSMGNGSSFAAAPIANHPGPHPWNDPRFGPRAAFERSGTDWWLHCAGWHAANGRRFFVSYYYRKLMEVGEETMRFVVDHAPDRYAISAPQEFFAEMFAWYYDMNHRTRATIPRRIGSWFEANVGAPDGFAATHVQT